MSPFDKKSDTQVTVKACGPLVSRHNRFAETHSHLQLSYNITDRLLAAGNKVHIRDSYNIAVGIAQTIACHLPLSDQNSTHTISCLVSASFKSEVIVIELYRWKSSINKTFLWLEPKCKLS